MDRLRIRNLRGLGDTGLVDIKPLTLLLGANGSGKSSFLRAFPLLRQSVEAVTTSPILWFGRYVDFGTFQTALNKDAQEDGIEIGFEASISTDEMDSRGVYQYSEDVMSSSVRGQTGAARVSLTLHQIPNSESSFISQLVVEFFGHTCMVILEPNGAIRQFIVNSIDFTRPGAQLRTRLGSSLVPDVLLFRSDSESVDLRERTTGFTRELFLEIAPLVRADTSFRTRRELLRKVSISDARQMLADIQSDTMPSATWRERVRDWHVDTPQFAHLSALLVANWLPRLLRTVSSHLSTTAQNVRYSAPLRANAERYYRFQDLAVNEVDPQGENLAMFLRNLSVTQKGHFSRWTAEHFGFQISLASVGDHRAIKLTDTASGSTFDLLDMGFGYSQVLPVITQLWMLRQGAGIRRLAVRRSSSPIIFAMEQPELHLHPAFQKRLMDSFVASIGNGKEGNQTSGNLRLVLETHSETLVNHLGQRVYEGAIQPEQINVLVFGRDPTGKGTMITSYFDSDGILRHWPHGFFSEGQIRMVE